MIDYGFMIYTFLYYFFPQHSLYFFPDPHGHASFGAGVFFEVILFTSIYVSFSYISKIYIIYDNSLEVVSKMNTIDLNIKH